ncbi:hypothetical protein GGI04_003562 [Coemansia thaxteri]|nr:hypothetical protein GGI04_003562 [Coemansia thaxteri]KAJ2470172.1 hypothetical protein GGI02_003103 [Coemansia sp. RSA 2322]
MSEAELIQSFVPAILAEEISRRYRAGNTALAQLVDHFSQRSQLEDLLASTIERAGGSGKFGSTRGTIRSNSGVGLLSSAKQNAVEEAAGLLPALQKEVDGLVRMHLHLSERINNEVVRPLQAFMGTDAWSIAQSIELKVRQMAGEMTQHHEQIPKLSARTVAKSAKASQQAKQRLDEETRALIELQKQWQKTIAGLVGDFETADVARAEAIRESVLKFEHYRSEFFKAAQSGTAAAIDTATAMHPSPRIIDVLSRGLRSSPTDQSASPNNDTQQPANNPPTVPPLPGQQQRTTTAESGSQLTNSESLSEQDGAKPKGFLNMFRGKTKRVRKKTSASEISVTSSQHSRSISSNVATPNIHAAALSVNTAHTREAGDSDGLSPVSSGVVVSSGTSSGNPRALSHNRGASFASSSHSARIPATEPGPPSTSGDFADWIYGEGNKPNVGPQLQDSTVLLADSLAPAARSTLSVIAETASPEKVSDAVFANEAAEGPVQGSEDKLPVSVEASLAPAAFVVDSWPEIGKPLGNQVTAISVGDASRIFGSMDAANFDDAFKLSSTQQDLVSFEQAPVVVDGGSSSTAAVDLDQAFSISAAAASVAPLSSEVQMSNGVFGSADAFRAKSGLDIKQSPQLSRLGGSPASNGGHRRSASADIGDKSPSIGSIQLQNDDDDRDDDNAEDDGDDGSAAEQSFRVKFSIREQAIRDNPDASKAALSRVTTLLRAAPSVRRRNRRDVRTMYVPSSLPVTEESLDPSEEAGDEQPPRTPMPLQADAASNSSRVEALVSEAFGGPATPLTPMPQRTDAKANTERTDSKCAPEPTSLDESGNADGMYTEAEDPLGKIVDHDAIEPKCSDSKTPVATATVTDTAAIVDTPALPISPHVDSLTVEPVSDAKTESASVASIGTDSLGASPLSKNESSVRRRAPPPPPLGPPGLRTRSVQQPSQSCVLTVASAAAADSSKVVSGAVADVALRSAAETLSLPTGNGNAERKGIQQEASASTSDFVVPDPNKFLYDDESAPQVVPDTAPLALSSSHRGRRIGSSSGPLAVAMHVRETLDFDFAFLSHEGPEVKHLVTGEVGMHIQSAIKPLELAPLRICIQRTEAAQWVANPAVVVLDASLTSSKADGREWYRFVRPNLFAHVDAKTGANVAVFKYQARGSGDLRVLPILLREVCSSSAGVCARMVFCEPNSQSVFAGDTIVNPAILLSMVGNITSQSSRPTAVWFQERNSLLWKLGDMDVPLPDTASEAEILAMSKTLAFKAQGDDDPKPGPVALKFEACNSRVLDVQIDIVRVAAGALATTTTVVEGLASRMVKSGKCTYIFNIRDDLPESPVGTATGENEMRGDALEHTARDKEAADPSSDHDASDTDGKDHSSASSSEAWPSDNEESAHGENVHAGASEA